VVPLAGDRRLAGAVLMDPRAWSNPRFVVTSFSPLVYPARGLSPG
jgi:hypothetical protein